MEAILGGMVEGVLAVNEHGRLQLVNTAARRMLRLQDAPEGRHYLEIIRQPDIAAQLGAALRSVASEGLELTLPRGSDRIIIARSAPVKSQTAGGAVLVIHDISELRRADRIRRDFVANVSHELRTPLTAVRGYVEALLDGAPDEEEARRFLEIIGRHTLRMERLVRDLLRLARLDAGQEPLEHISCSVESLFAGVEAELAPLIEGRSQIVEQRIAPDATSVTGDPAKLHDAFRNLLENAANYSPDRGRIVMASCRRGNLLVLTVSDEGPGVPEADLRGARSGRNRPRPRDRQAPDRAARWDCQRRKSAGRRGNLHDRAARIEIGGGGEHGKSAHHRGTEHAEFILACCRYEPRGSAVNALSVISVSSRAVATAQSCARPRSR
jgi:two-component system, OmpR family, phosphate regulon sensor histidine kinase PhoR